MNDNERDRSGDGAGPRDVPPRSKTRQITVAHIKNITLTGLLCSLFMLQGLSFSCFAHPTQPSSLADMSVPLSASLRGLSLTVDVGVLRPSNEHANFYNGNPGNANTLYRILHSETYGNHIWNNLTTQDLIGSSIANYNQLTVAEYGDMYYKLAFQLGMGFRYDLTNPHWAWQVKFDYAKLHALGQVLLYSGRNTAYLTNQNAYVNCPASGVEERIYIDLGIIRKFKLDNHIDFELSLGGNVNNTKVESSDIQIGGITYNILDIWGGQSPSSYVASYEYINQGGIGYGGYLTLSVGFTLPVGTAMNLAYTFHFNKVALQGYESFAPHHAVSLNVALNNFSFFDT